MGIYADNAHELVVTFEGMTFDLRAKAEALAAYIARRANRPLADHADELAKALAKDPGDVGSGTQNEADVERLLDLLDKESRNAMQAAGAAARQHWGQGKTEFGDFRDAYGKMAGLRQTVLDIRKELEMAEMHALATQEFRNMEKGLREAGL